MINTTRLSSLGAACQFADDTHVVGQSRCSPIQQPRWPISCTMVSGFIDLPEPWLAVGLYCSTGSAIQPYDSASAARVESAQAESDGGGHDRRRTQAGSNLPGEAGLLPLRALRRAGLHEPAPSSSIASTPGSVCLLRKCGATNRTTAPAARKNTNCSCSPHSSGMTSDSGRSCVLSHWLAMGRTRRMSCRTCPQRSRVRTRIACSQPCRVTAIKAMVRDARSWLGFPRNTEIGLSGSSACQTGQRTRAARSAPWLRWGPEAVHRGQ